MANFNNYIIVILDSCRFDSFQKAGVSVMSRLGEVERRWSYASWTAPSHYNLLTGLLPTPARKAFTPRSTTSATF